MYPGIKVLANQVHWAVIREKNDLNFMFWREETGCYRTLF